MSSHTHILEVLLEVPETIFAGLKSGDFVRDAAGVVRVAQGRPGAGSIVAHLKEHGGAGVQHGANLELMVSTALQLAALKHIDSQLGRIRGQLGDLQRAVDAIHVDVRETLEHSRAAIIADVRVGVDFWARFQELDAGDDSYRAEAERRFFTGRRRVLDTLEALPADELIAKRDWVEQLVVSLVVAEGGLASCDRARGANRVSPAMHLIGAVASIERRLGTVQPVHLRFPSKSLIGAGRPGAIRREMTEQFGRMRRGLELAATEPVKLGAQTAANQPAPITQPLSS